MKLFPKQRASMRESIKRLNIWHGSVRSGKTHVSILRFIQAVATAPHGEIYIIGKTQDTVYRNVIKLMEEMLGGDFYYNRGNREAYLWGRTITVLGANDSRSEKKIRGSTCSCAYCDEITLWDYEFFSMLLSRLSVRGAKLFGSTNPDHPKHWLKTNYLDRADVLDLAIFHFEIDDNIYLNPEYVKQIKLEYTGLWYKRFILGLWTAAEGSIYDFFNEETYVHEPESHDMRGEKCWITIDYGTTNSCVFLSMCQDQYGKYVWCDDEYVWDARKEMRQKDDAEYAADLLKFITDKCPATPKAIVIDPSAASFIVAIQKMLREAGLYIMIVPADNSVLDGIRNQATCLKTGKYFIRPRCVETIAEYYAYMWDLDASNIKGVDTPRKAYDHTKDAERYFLLWFFMGDTIDYSRSL